MKDLTRYSILISIFFWGICSFLRAEDILFSELNASDGLSDNQVRYICQLDDGRMVFTTSGNVNFYDGAHFKYTHKDEGDIYELKEYHGHYRIYKGKDSLLWIKDHNKLMCIDVVREKYIHNVREYLAKAGFVDEVDDLFIDDLKGMWLRSGECLYSVYEKSSYLLPQKGKGLQDITADRKNIYLFFNTGEVICLNRKTKKILYSSRAYEKEEIENYRETSLVIDSENKIYQLRNGKKGGFFVFNKKEQKWKKLLETEYILNTLIIDGEKNALISCATGYWKFDLKEFTKVFIPALKTEGGEIINTEISTLFKDREGGLWLGTKNRGIFYNHPSRYKINFWGKREFGAEETHDFEVLKFIEDKNGYIFIRTDKKVYGFNPSSSTSKISAISTKNLDSDVFSKLFDEKAPTAVNVKGETCFLVDSRGWRWTGTHDGLILEEKSSGFRKVFYTLNGLSNNFIHGVIEDRNRDIWISTSFGITRIKCIENPRQFQIASMNKWLGVLDNEFINGASLLSKTGLIMFGGVNGFNAFYPEDQFRARLLFRPILTNIKIVGDNLEIGKKYGGHIILKRSTVFTDTIDLSYDQNFINLEYSALNFINPENVYFRYKLEGIDSNWQESKFDILPSSDKRNKGILNIIYTNLPPGFYKLIVETSENDIDWNNPSAVLNINVFPPWWKTSIAYIIYSLCVCGIVLLAFRIHGNMTKNNLQRKHKEDLLLLRIRNLIEQYNLLEAGICTKNEIEDDLIGNKEESKQLTAFDSEFLSKAIEQVEKNLSDHNYSVLQLSKDLCMDRTGLYRKLILLLDKSPSLFIRSVRLNRAAQLLAEGELSIFEITEKVGFSSSSYFSRCFQEMYNCRPSEYGKKMRIKSPPVSECS